MPKKHTEERPTVEIPLKGSLVKITDGLASFKVGEKTYTAKNRRVTRRLLARLGLEPPMYIEGQNNPKLASAASSSDRVFIGYLEGDSTIAALKVKRASKEE